MLYITRVRAGKSKNLNLSNNYSKHTNPYLPRPSSTLQPSRTGISPIQHLDCLSCQGSVVYDERTVALCPETTELHLYL